MIIFNGEPIKGSELSDSILLGDGVFETLRSYEGRFFALERHLNRLESGLLELLQVEALPKRYDRSQILEAIAKTANDDGFPTGALRVSVYTDCNWVISHKPYQPPNQMIRCLTLEEEFEKVAFKSASYARRLRLRRYAEKMGCDDAILVGQKEEISELSTSNLLALIDGNWITPRLESGALPGVTRWALIESFGVKESFLTKGHLDHAQALASISSLREIQGIKEIDGKSTPISNELRELQESFHRWILGNLAL